MTHRGRSLGSDLVLSEVRKGFRPRSIVIGPRIRGQPELRWQLLNTAYFHLYSVTSLRLVLRQLNVDLMAHSQDFFPPHLNPFHLLSRTENSNVTVLPTIPLLTGPTTVDVSSRRSDFVGRAPVQAAGVDNKDILRVKADLKATGVGRASLR